MLAFPPDLTPLDFFLQDHLKDRIYTNPKTQNLGQLEDNVCRDKSSNNNKLFPKVMHNIAACMQNVFGLRGAYVEHVI